MGALFSLIQQIAKRTAHNAWLIVSFSRPYDAVLDPFAGAGTTAKMALLNGRRWLGFEINPEYVGIAHGRLRKAERLLWAS